MVIGITGSFGSGKTSVAKMFMRLGAYVIDADKICHSLMAPSKNSYKKIVSHFGSNILKRNKTIDRRELARVVFNEGSKLKLLNRLIHPEAIRKMDKIIKAKRKGKVIVIDAPLLVESGFYKKMDRLIVVKTERCKQIRRLVRTKGMSKKEISRRIKTQAPLKKKLAFADFIIDNSGSKRETLLQVEKIWKQLGVGYGCKRKAGY